MGDPTAQAPDLKAVDFKESLCPIEPNHEDIYGVPTLAELGFEETNRLSPWLGIEYLLNLLSKWNLLSKNTCYQSGKKALYSSCKFWEIFTISYLWWKTGGEYQALERLKIKMQDQKLMKLPKRYLVMQSVFNKKIFQSRRCKISYRANNNWSIAIYELRLFVTKTFLDRSRQVLGLWIVFEKIFLDWFFSPLKKVRSRQNGFNQRPANVSRIFLHSC